MRRLLLAALLCLAGWQAQAATAFHAAGGLLDWGTGTNIFWTHTNTVTTTMELVFVTNYGTQTVTAVTLDPLGTPLSCTVVATKTGSDGGSPTVTEAWKCPNPPTSAHTVSVDFSGATSFVLGQSLSYTGSGTTIDTSATGNESNCAAGTSCSLATTVNDAGDWLVGVVFERFGTVSASTGTTLRNAIQGHTAAVGDSGGTVSTGSQALAWTANTSGNWPGQITVALCPSGGCAAAGAAPTNGGLFLGGPF